MQWYNIIINYLIIGTILNLCYDLTISAIQKEDLRFNMMERITFALIWPIYAIFLVYNFIKNIFDESDEG